MGPRSLILQRCTFFFIMDVIDIHDKKIYIDTKLQWLNEL